MNNQRLILAAAEFASAAAAFTHAVLLPPGEHRVLKVGEALAVVRRYADRVEEAVLAAPLPDEDPIKGVTST